MTNEPSSNELMAAWLDLAAEMGASLCGIHAAHIASMVSIEQSLAAITGNDIAGIEKACDKSITLARNLAKMQIVQPNN